MKRTALVVMVLAVLLLLVVPVSAAEVHLPPVTMKQNGVAVVDADVLLAPSAPSESLSCICYMLRHEPIDVRLDAPDYRPVPQRNLPI